MLDDLLEAECRPATAGDIAVINLHSATRASWSRFWRDPGRPGVAELVVEQEQTAASFLGVLGAFDRLEGLADEFQRAYAEPVRVELVRAQLAALTHRFDEARLRLSNAVAQGAAPMLTQRLSLSIDQACGTDLDAVLAERRRIAAASNNLADLVPLAALLADLGEADEADKTYRKALRGYDDVSPFAPAWACFQLGCLWGEVVAEPDHERAAMWYRKAIDYLPAYVKARVHLAEIELNDDRLAKAEALLRPALTSGDPEVAWRLADALHAAGRTDEADHHLRLARDGFEALLGKHLLAFADHGAEFYAGSGNDPQRAFELARANLANRPTLRAFAQAHDTAVGAGDQQAAATIAAAAEARWASTAAFRSSPLRAAAEAKT